MSATHAIHFTPTAGPVLYVAFRIELGDTWKLAFTVSAGQPPRIRSVPARCTRLVLDEIKKAKLPALVSRQTPRWCRATKPGATASGSIASSGLTVIREPRRRFREHRGQSPQAQSQVRPPRCRQAGEHADALAQRREEGLVGRPPPSAEDEDHRQLHRELIALKSERTGHAMRSRECSPVWA